MKRLTHDTIIVSNIISYMGYSNEMLSYYW